MQLTTKVLLLYYAKYNTIVKCFDALLAHPTSLRILYGESVISIGVGTI